MSPTNVSVLDQPNITFAIIKSDAVKNNVSNEIIALILESGFSIIYKNDVTPTKVSMSQTVKFYYEHVGRPYFPELIKSLADGSIPLILEYLNKEESAVKKLRDLIGATNSRNAEPNTIRGRFGGHVFNLEAPVAENAIHGSDSLISALNEIKIIFPHLTEIESVVYGKFQLDQFQVGVIKLPEKIKILYDDNEEFLRKFNNGELPKQNLGRAFYNYFKLHESILKDNTQLSEMCNKTGDEAIAYIANFIDFI